MNEFQNLLDVLQSIPFYLQLLAGAAILGVIAVTAVGAIIAWQLSAVVRALREAGHRSLPPAPPPQYPSGYRPG